MILVDTSIWIDHLRKPQGGLTRLLSEWRVLTHPFILGEIALGSLKDRLQVLANLAALPAAVSANDDEVLTFIDAEKLAGSGIGYVDAHLLASTRLTRGAKIWARDKKLSAAAAAIGLAVTPLGEAQ